jgi:hypothetical protein
MSTFVTELNDEQHSRWFLLEIEFDYTAPDRIHVTDTDWAAIDGQIYILSVKVMAANEYGPCGDVVKRFLRILNTDCILEEFLDLAAYDLVAQEIDQWNNLADEMVESIA